MNGNTTVACSRGDASCHRIGRMRRCSSSPACPKWISGQGTSHSDTSRSGSLSCEKKGVRTHVFSCDPFHMLP